MSVESNAESNYVVVSFRAKNREDAIAGANAVVGAYREIVSGALDVDSQAALERLNVAIEEATTTLAGTAGVSAAASEAQISAIVSELAQIRDGTLLPSDVTARVRELEAELKAWLLVAQAEASLPAGLAAQRERDDALALLSELRSRQSRLEVDSRLSGDGVALFSPAERAKSDGVPTIAALAIGIVLGALVGAGLAYWRDARTQAFSSRYGPRFSSTLLRSPRYPTSGVRGSTRGCPFSRCRERSRPRPSDFLASAHRHLGRPEVERASGRTRTGLAAALPGAERPRARGTEPRRERRPDLRSRSQGLRPQPRDGRSHAPRDPRQAGRDRARSRQAQDRRGRARVESAERGQESGARKRRRRPSLRRLRRRVVPRRYDDAPRQYGAGSRTGGQSGARDRRRRGQAGSLAAFCSAPTMRRPRQNEDPTKGLADLLLHGASAESIVQVMETSAGGTLSLLAPGTAAMDAAGGFRTDQIVAAFESVRDQFDRVVIDLPPIREAAYADALLRSAAAVVLVVPHRSGAASLRHALDRLDLLGIHRSGTCTTSRRLRRRVSSRRPLPGWPARIAGRDRGTGTTEIAHLSGPVSPGSEAIPLRSGAARGVRAVDGRRRGRAGCAEARRGPRSAGLRGRPRPRGRRRAPPGGDSSRRYGSSTCAPARPDVPPAAGSLPAT